jgi:glycosyltransferase involved in cell wall biosynthesis
MWDDPPMRLLVVSHTGLRSGAEIVLERIVEAAATNGWEVVAVAPPGPAAESLALAGASVVPLPDLALGRGHKSWAALRLLGRNARAVPVVQRAAREADVVLVNGVLGLPVVAAARLKVPVVWLVHDVISRADRRALVRLARGSVRCAVAVSEVAAGPVRSKRIPVAVIPAGTPYPVRARPPELTGPAVVGYAAALAPWKGHQVLLDAFSTVAHRTGATLELLGSPFPRDDSYAATLRRRADAEDLRGRVRFLGYQSDPGAIVRRWTVAVSASVEPEAVGLSTLEAMSLGVPVVGTDLGATHHLLGEAGLLVKAGDVAAMAAAIIRLIEDPEQWARCHRAGPPRVAQEFRLDLQLERTLDLLAEVARSREEPTVVHHRGWHPE